MNKNDIFEIEITGMTEDGSGVGRAEGLAVFVPYTIIGEKVRVLITKVLKTYAFAKLLEVIEPSENRLKSECPYFYKCGGCQLWHMDYSAELEYKQKKVEDAILRIGKIDTEVSPIVGCDLTERYRNKVQLPVSENGIGFYRRNSHDVIDMDDCLLQTEQAKKIVDIVRDWIKKYEIKAYDEKENNGILRHIYLREGKEGVLLTLVVTDKDVPNINKLINSLKTDVVGIVLNINSKNTNVVLGRENITVFGKGTLADKIGDVEFEISPNSFYQVNALQTYKLYDIARNMVALKGNETLWDMYCGIGTIGQFMASKAGRIVGVEIVPEAIEDAKKNAVRNNIKNAEYYCGAAEDLADGLIKKGLKPDVVILDPPRKGCDEKLLNTVVGANPERIVYVSCKPSTLARDLKYLTEKGYNVKKIVPVDMFPRTSHVECCVLLCRK